MSDIATELVWSESKSCRGSRLVMLALAHEADEKGKATLTLGEISRLTRLTARSITKCLKELATLGELVHERGGGVSNPNSYSILLIDQGTATPPDSSTEILTPSPEAPEGGTRFQEASSQNAPATAASGKSLQDESEVSSTRGGNTPYGSITTNKKQASWLEPSRQSHGSEQDSVKVPDGAKELVIAITGAGMLVGWRLTESEWDRVTVLASRWGHKRLVEMVARRWNTDRPPQSARYLLRIWADLPSHTPATATNDNVVPLRRQPGAWVTFQTAAEPSAYENGF